MFTRHNLSTASRRGALSLLCALLFSLSVSGCFMPEDEPPPPPQLAVLQVIHQNQQQGAVEVLFDGVPILEISYGESGNAVTIPVGSGSFGFRNAGAPSTFSETDVFDLTPNKVYTFALVDESIEESFVLDLTAAPPLAEEGLHWVRFVDLSNLDGGTIFRGEDPIQELPLDDNPSAFLSVESASSTSLGLTKASGAPGPSRNTSFPSGGASLIIIGGDNESPTLSVLPLDEERISADSAMTP